MLLNARSINNKVYEIRELLLKHNIDVGCVTETWLREGPSTVVADFKREGLEVVSLPRKERKGGGVALISKNKCYRIKQIKTERYKTFELLEVILLGNLHNLRFSIVYRTGPLCAKTKNNFFEELNDYSEKLITKPSTNILLGDFNIRVERKNNLTSEFLDILCSKGFKQTITGPTHRDGGTLDLVFIQDNCSLKSTVLKDEQISDHYPIKNEILFNPVKLPTHYLKEYRNFSGINSSVFKDEVKSSITKIMKESWTQIKLSSIIDALNRNLQQIIDKRAPTIKKESRFLTNMSKMKKYKTLEDVKGKQKKLIKKQKKKKTSIY